MRDDPTVGEIESPPMWHEHRCQYDVETLHAPCICRCGATSQDGIFWSGVGGTVSDA